MIAPLTASELHRLVAGLVEDGYPAPTSVDSPILTDHGIWPGTVWLRSADVARWADSLGFVGEWAPFAGTVKDVYRADACGFQLRSMREHVAAQGEAA